MSKQSKDRLHDQALLVTIQDHATYLSTFFDISLLILYLHAYNLLLGGLGKADECGQRGGGKKIQNFCEHHM